MSSPQIPLSVSLRNIWAGYQKFPVLEDVSLEIKAGDFAGVIGPNGSGKSTLIKVILGLLKPACGQVLVGGVRPALLRSHIGYLPQLTQIDFNFPATVLDVVLMGRYGRIGLFNVPGKKDKEKVMIAVERVGLAKQINMPVGHLSGGQRQRAFIARAIAQEPKLLLLDEPISGVDITTQHDVSHLLEELNRSGITIVSTTHDLNCVASSFNRVICLNKKIVAVGAPDVVLTQEILNKTYGAHLLMTISGDKLAPIHEDRQEVKVSNKTESTTI